MFKQLGDLCDTIGDYWRIYGGLKEFLLSPFIWFSIAISLNLQGLWLWSDAGEPSWIQAAIEIVPSLLGFSMGGMAILLAFTNSRFFRAITEGGKKDSLYVETIATFLHFILWQLTALIMAFFAREFANDYVSGLGFFSLVYAIFTALGVALKLFTMAQLHNVAIEKEADTMSDDQLMRRFAQLLKAMAGGEPASKTLAKGSATSSAAASEGSSDTRTREGKFGDISGKPKRKSPDKRP